TLSCSSEVIEGSGINIVKKKGITILGFKSSSERRIVKIGELYVYILDRNDAYNYWVLDLPSSPVSGNYTNGTIDTSAAIVKAGYLLRTVEASGTILSLTGDLNATTEIEIIGGAPAKLTELKFNGETIKFAQDSCSGVVTASATYSEPSFSVPDLSTVDWKVTNSLPEIVAGYDDSLWTNADLTYSNNTQRNLTTPVSLYAQDYGYNIGNLLYRGHFTATGGENSIYLQTQGGSAFGMSAWLNGTFLGSARGIDAASNANSTFSLPNVASGSSYVLTVLIDHMGLQENGQGGSSEMKTPRGILNYSLNGRNASAISWKLTGNLGGEDYQDRTRGPLNEGGLYAERQGYHLPGAPTSSWSNSTHGPMIGITAPGVAFYSTTFDLDMPAGYDIPIAISFSNATSSTNGSASVAYRSQIYVNGYQFGKYVSNIGPQDVFPVPQGIFDYNGPNYLAVSLWALDEGGAKISNLSLVAGPVIQSDKGPCEFDGKYYCKSLVASARSRIPASAPEDQLPYRGSIQEHVKFVTDCEAVLYDLIKEPQVQRVARPTLLHADLHKRNIFVSDSEPSKITGIIDWQSTSIEPAFVYANETPDFATLVDDMPRTARDGQD
ncbi:putative beta-galactosidase, partial [Aureobasidium pullulans]